MSGGKACGKQAALYTGKQPDEPTTRVTTRATKRRATDEGSGATSRYTAVAEGDNIAGSRASQEARDAVVAEIEVHQRCALRQHSCKPLCPAWSDVIATNIEVSQRCALRQHSVKTLCPSIADPIVVQSPGHTHTTCQATQTQPALLAELQALHHTQREATRLFLMAASQGAREARCSH